MGSIGCVRETGLSDKTFFEGEYPSFEILATARKASVVYAAAKRRDGDEVFALVMPVSRGGGYFYYKEQDETCGPCDAEAPARVLALLSETDDEHANAWRARCRENLVKSEAAKARAKAVREGTMIRTAEPMFFGERYGSYDTFRYTGKGSTFLALQDGVAVLRVSLTRWKERDYEVVGALGAVA